MKSISRIVAASAIALAGAAEAEPRRRSLAEQMSPVAGASFGLQEVCLRAIASDPGAAEHIRGLPPHKASIYPRQASYWIGPKVTVSLGPKTCTVRAVDGEAAKLREVMLGGLPGDARVLFDSGAEGRDGSGLYRQEQHCFALDGRPACLLMSTSATRGRVPLQASVCLDETGRCAPR
jgi:hypothetical protein